MWRYYQHFGMRRPKIWTSGIALVGCVPKVYDFKELISQCIDKFDNEQRIIQLQEESPISLAPLIFKRMFRLPKRTMIFKSAEVDDLLKMKKGGFKLLRNYLEDPTIKISQIFKYVH